MVLGVFWILDAALQFQPFMFERGFVETYVLQNASGQPAVVSWVITNIGHFIEPSIVVGTHSLLLIQLVIGVGLLLPPHRPLRPGYVFRLGARRLGTRRRHRLGPHRLFHCTHRGSGFGLHVRALGLLAWPTGR